MIIYVEDLIRYNANKYSKDTGDCVRRSLSLAYDIPYREVEKELNDIKNNKFNGRYPWNNYMVFEEFMRRHGLKDKTYLTNPTTVKDFANTNNQGIYCVTCGKRSTGSSTHIVCIISGNIYDSWDCQNWYVFNVYTISGDSPEILDSDLEYYNKFILECIDKYSKKYLKKYNKYYLDGAKFSVDPNIYNNSNYNASVKMSIDINNKYLSNSYSMNCLVNWSPRADIETNKKDIDEKVYYEVWKLCKYPADILWRMIEEDEFSQNTELNFGDHKLEQYPAPFVKKLAPWVSKVVIYSRQEDLGTYYGYSPNTKEYYLEIIALPGDPNVETEGDTIYFHTDTLGEMRKAVDTYKKTFKRIYTADQY